MFPNVHVSNTLSSHFLHDREIVSNKHGMAAVSQEHICWQGGAGERGRAECIFRNQGGSFLVYVPTIVMSLWKLMPVVRGQGLLSWVCLYQWKNPHLALGPQSTVRLDHIAEKNLTYEEHINTAGGRWEGIFSHKY